MVQYSQLYCLAIPVTGDRGIRADYRHLSRVDYVEGVPERALLADCLAITVLVKLHFEPDLSYLFV